MTFFVSLSGRELTNLVHASKKINLIIYRHQSFRRSHNLSQILLGWVLEPLNHDSDPSAEESLRLTIHGAGSRSADVTD